MSYSKSIRYTVYLTVTLLSILIQVGVSLFVLYRVARSSAHDRDYILTQFVTATNVLTQQVNALKVAHRTAPGASPGASVAPVALPRVLGQGQSGAWDYMDVQLGDSTTRHYKRSQRPSKITPIPNR